MMTKVVACLLAATAAADGGGGELLWANGMAQKIYN